MSRSSVPDIVEPRPANFPISIPPFGWLSSVVNVAADLLGRDANGLMAKLFVDDPTSVQ